MSENMITIKGLKKVFRVREKVKDGMWATLNSLFQQKYRYITAVDGINFNIKKGEIRGLIGPNGAGKSTVIKIISGILFPTEGTVEVLGYIPWLQRQEYVKNIGVVLGQKTQLLWDLPPSDTFLLNKAMYKIPDKKFKENVNYFKEILNIEDVIKRPVRNLSLGERMKCELVCAMLHEPQLVYLDEPTIGLDVFAKESMRQFIKDINRDKGVTIILTTHDLDDVEDLCKNVTIINKGAIVCDDSIEQLKSIFSNKKAVEVKFSRPVENSLLREFNIIHSTSLTAKIEFDLSKSKLQEEIYRLFSIFPIQDLNIESIRIEDVIKHYYNEQTG